MWKNERKVKTTDRYIQSQVNEEKDFVQLIRYIQSQENVIYWSEYVINHKGAPHLRVEGLNLGFIEYHNLDVFLVLIIGFVVLIVLPQILCCRFIFRKMFSKPSKSKVKTN